LIVHHKFTVEEWLVLSSWTKAFKWSWNSWYSSWPSMASKWTYKI